MRLSVNGVEIGEQAIGREMRHHPADSVETAWKRAARALVIRELLLQAARREAAVSRDVSDDETLIQSLLSRVTQIPEPDEAACRRYFDAHPDRFRSPMIHRVSHILYAASPDDARTRCEARSTAETALREIGGDPRLFAAVAARDSACPSREEGGDLGWIPRGQTVPEFEEAFMELAPGRIAPRPVETRYGIHLVLLHAREGGEPLSFESARHRVAGHLHRRALRCATTRYLQRLVSEARIEGIRLEGDDAPPAR